jgi:peptidyl-prolyl cis-trans isomerase D
VLEALRRNSKNTIIYVLFGILIAVFVTTFGPGSRSGGGCVGSAASSYAAQVGGATVSEQDFRFAYIALGGSQISPQFAKMRRLKEFIMDKLIERELLIQEAQRLGLSVSQKEVEDMIYEGRMYVLGIPRKVDEYVFVDGAFNYEHFKAVCKNRLGVEVAKFIEQEQRELMAERVRQLMLSGTRVLPDDVKADWQQRETQANLEFVKFQPRRYADQLELAPADVDAYRKAHEADLKKSYDEHGYQYKKIDREARLRRIAVAVAKDATPDKEAAAKAKIEDAAKRVKEGQPFAQAVKNVSDDERTKARGGELGWRKKGLTGLGAAVEEKIFAAKKGDVVGPEKTERGWELVQVEDFREGDIPFEQVAGEIAEEQLRNEKARDQARVEATAALAKVKAGEALDKLFPKPTDTDENSDPFKKLSAPPSVQETGLFARRGELIPDLGVSSDLMKQVFAGKQGDLLGPVEVGGAIALARIKERKEADLGEFEKKKADILRQYERAKWAESLDAWAKQRCTEVRDEGHIHVNDEVLAYEGTKGEVKYEPCAIGPRF